MAILGGFPPSFRAALSVEHLVQVMPGQSLRGLPCPRVQRVRCAVSCGPSSHHRPWLPALSPWRPVFSGVPCKRLGLCGNHHPSLSLSLFPCPLSLSDLTTTYPSAPVVSSALHICSYSQHSPPSRVSRLCREPKHHKRPCPSHPLPLTLHSSPFSLTHTFRIPLLIILSR